MIFGRWPPPLHFVNFWGFRHRRNSGAPNYYILHPIFTRPSSAVPDCTRDLEGRVDLKDESGKPGLRYKRQGRESGKWGGKNGVGERLEKMGWKKGVESRWKIK